MMAQSKILAVAKDKGLGESGGGHNQKGVDFQRYWTIHRLIELEESGAEDFLLLIEAIQDVAELDSKDSPSKVTLYQVKKKDRKEWSWSELTKIKKPTRKKTEDIKDFGKSPIGKIYATMVALDDLGVQSKFISNQGCDLALAGGGSAATTKSSRFSDLPDSDRVLLISAMKACGIEADPSTRLANIRVEKVPIPVDDPRTHLVGVAHEFIRRRSPTHANQASSFVDALMGILGPLGAKTDSCSNFEELCKEHGYTKQDFVNALGTLETIPDRNALIETWINKLASEGVDLTTIMSVKAQIVAIFRRRVQGVSDTFPELADDCESFRSENPFAGDVAPILEKGYQELRGKHIEAKKTEIWAQIITGAILCVDQV
ncbi:dsDNA nuclease domain-containing protein [Kineobactrum salinum]|uniref:DUF4297 domain-containing protein n=1 Tax=Kineobactrum salinum TaxID=2708301 RepID=A0A6C0U0R3_9GAMM|nr:dsDNA nuclease domain-containing protein [Kineobactrum salinum]QIB65159.1 DUF4297 domain-containing protein [Kineobactrum salinum]